MTHIQKGYINQHIITSWINQYYIYYYQYYSHMLFNLDFTSDCHIINNDKNYMYSGLLLASWFNRNNLCINHCFPGALIALVYMGFYIFWIRALRSNKSSHRHIYSRLWLKWNMTSYSSCNDTTQDYFQCKGTLMNLQTFWNQSFEHPPCLFNNHPAVSNHTFIWHLCNCLFNSINVWSIAIYPAGK